MLYHGQTGDLRTPNTGISDGTPLSLSTTTAAGLQPGALVLDVHGFSPQTIQPHQFHNFNPFASHDTFAPDQLTKQPSGFEPVGAPADGIVMDTDMQEDSSIMPFHSGRSGANGVATPPSHSDSFRFHVTLHAPTAMTRHADEVPVTYLNKGQAYSMTIIDTSPLLGQSHFRYRTFIRISFEDEQQRQRPGACWQLWKEGRGTNEAHERGGKLRAVEFVDTSQSSEDESKFSRVEIDTSSFDGFSVIWSPGPSGARDCSIAARFNFLSTDFSHSKGVKGIPVRLCAKTEVIESGSPLSPPSSSPEICYCRVKLFRDHGAERKLSNDVAHVRKTIDKLKQQVSQAETGIRDLGRKKRPGSASKTIASARTGKAPKHKRTWSMSSASSSGGRPPAEEDLQMKLATMQDMFTSPQPVSVLNLRGSEEDDPDLHPIRLPGESQDLTSRGREDIEWNRRQSAPVSNATRTASLISPSPSSTSLQSQGITRVGFPPRDYNQLDQEQNGWSNYQPLPIVELHRSPNPQHLASPLEQPVRIPKSTDGSTNDLSRWIEALGIDPSYRAPSERSVMPVACIYIVPAKSEKSSKVQYYRAVYLMERTAQDLTSSIAMKFGIDPASVSRATHVNSKGLNIVIDDDVVREIPEGQDMRVEITETKLESRREWRIGPGEDDDDIRTASGMDDGNPARFEIKLLF
ncbi:hypothetical protein GP486_006600 [Trichoglossum hirsutum]|uniref:Grh/CP2 DB domain-containing protein n=1 Tax=Trichoglossum hirsutum TaxID=265104 RepID=A0A9P8I7U0_9PEZI|nr:hypothetical protein GP486_006600 [Trichoglossum hirsutum]